MLGAIMLPGMSDNFFESEEKAKKKVRGPSRARQEKICKSAPVVESDIQRVYEHWCAVMRPNRKNPAKLDLKGRECVAAAISDYGIDTCLRAIDGCSKSSFHMGRNKQNRRYDSLELIFRNHEKIEQFLSYLQSDDEPW
jgi:hypothetical protein